MDGAKPIANQPGTSARLLTMSTACGLLAVVSGASVLIGWAFDVEVLIRLRPDWPPQTPITAFCLALLGLALVLREQKRAPWFSYAATGLVLAVSSIKLASFLFYFDFPVERLLFASKLAPEVTVAPNTAMCLALLSLASLLSINKPRLLLAARACAIVGGVIAGFALIGHFAGIFGLYQMGNAIPMRFQTALTALIIALGLLSIGGPLAGFDREESDVLPFSSRLLTAMFTLLLLILGASFWGERQTDATAELAFATKNHALETEEILSTLQDAEIGQRGYLVTEDEKFLEPYNNAVAKTGTLQERFNDLRSNDPAAEPYIPQLQELTDKCLAMITGTIALAKNGQRDQAIAYVKTGRGKAVMDQIRLVIANVNAARSTVMAKQVKQRDKAITLVKITEISGLLFLVVTGIIVLRQMQITLAAQRRARDAATAANRAKSSFLASMSHELRTPMTGIMGMCDLLLSGSQSAEDRQITRILARSAQTLLALLNDILDLSKIESGRLTLEDTDFKLSNLLEDTTSLFGPIASQKGLIFNIDTTPLAHDVFKGDPARIQQVLSNLVGNAVKFTERGNITVTHTQARTSDGKTVVKLEVKDTGIGIGPEGQARLFRDFEQEDSSTSRRYGGSGLGLSISRRLVEAMGGSIGVESAKGKGSRFFFTVTLTDGDEKTVRARASGNAMMAGDHLRGLRLNVLLAEDTPATQHLVTTMLSRWGHSVTAVSDGLAATQAAAEKPWDIILMDMQMPVMDGPDAIRIIRAGNGPSSEAPIIALTADAVRDNHQEYLEAGANLVATKPIDWQLLAQKIAGLVDKPAGQQSPEAAPATPVVETRTGSSAHDTQPILQTDILNDLQDMIGNDAFQAVMVSTLNSIGQSVAELAATPATADTTAIKRLAHKIKGLTAQVGAVRASAVAQHIETGAVVDLEAAVQSLQTAVSEAEHQLKAHLAALKSTAAAS